MTCRDHMVYIESLYTVVSRYPRLEFRDENVNMFVLPSFAPSSSSRLLTSYFEIAPCCAHQPLPSCLIPCLATVRCSLGDCKTPLSHITSRPRPVLSSISVTTSSILVIKAPASVSPKVSQQCFLLRFRP
jgi:hypothetical protein